MNEQLPSPSLFSRFKSSIASIYRSFAAFLFSEKMRNFLKSISLEFMKFAEEKAVKLALVKLLGSAKVGGFRAWVLTWIVKNIIFEKALEPLFKAIFKQIGYSMTVAEGHVKIQSLEAARNSGDEDAYDEARDDIYN